MSVGFIRHLTVIRAEGRLTVLNTLMHVKFIGHYIMLSNTVKINYRAPVVYLLFLKNKLKKINKSSVLRCACCLFSHNWILHIHTFKQS